MNRDYSAADLLRILRLSQAELRSCLRSALLPLSRRGAPCTYSFQQLVLLRTTQGLREAGVPVRQIRTVLASLQRQLGEDQTLSSVKIYASGQRVVVWDGISQWHPSSGQFLLNFDTAQLVKILKLKPARRPGLTPAESSRAWFHRAMILEEDSIEEARRAYQEAIQLYPSFVEAHINLGRLHHNVGEFAEAEICYRRAIKYGPDVALAHFNLGVVLEDQGERQGALAAYEEALHWQPDFREAHCHVAQLYERLGRRRDAVRHYAAAKRLQT